MEEPGGDPAASPSPSAVMTPCPHHKYQKQKRPLPLPGPPPPGIRGEDSKGRGRSGTDVPGPSGLGGPHSGGSQSFPHSKILLPALWKERDNSGPSSGVSRGMPLSDPLSQTAYPALPRPWPGPGIARRGLGLGWDRAAPGPSPDFLPRLLPPGFRVAPPRCRPRPHPVEAPPRPRPCIQAPPRGPETADRAPCPSRKRSDVL